QAEAVEQVTAVELGCLLELGDRGTGCQLLQPPDIQVEIVEPERDVVAVGKKASVAGRRQRLSYRRQRLPQTRFGLRLRPVGPQKRGELVTRMRSATDGQDRDQGARLPAERMDRASEG